MQRVASHLQLAPEVLGELLVTEYPPGSVINWHRDAPPFDVIAGISLNTDCTFKLRPHEKSRQGSRSVISIPVGRRSFYNMTGEQEAPGTIVLPLLNGKAFQHPKDLKGTGHQVTGLYSVKKCRMY